MVLLQQDGIATVYTSILNTFVNYQKVESIQNKSKALYSISLCVHKLIGDYFVSRLLFLPLIDITMTVL